MGCDTGGHGNKSEYGTDVAEGRMPLTQMPSDTKVRELRRVFEHKSDAASTPEALKVKDSEVHNNTEDETESKQGEIQSIRERIHDIDLQLLDYNGPEVHLLLCEYVQLRGRLTILEQKGIESAQPV